ncbi:helix-turn-helix domain-containing protein [Sulfitobacter delicatus]|uniref:Helix-turn-helix domain-containing protein n=1 Tax=Sulfitobacter delicatus TaxID=218672 RepID=A0A1G7RCE4_9RHOB|nr:helix-turn-helix domain-containing protein [Sulfitobacter delicatus]SDG08466.1 Helix-turn-helix domain-containing protein [Sulfitobacter delicatus]
MQRKPGNQIQIRPPGSFISEATLSEHWDISKRTLQRWRKSGEGPPYVLIGGSVRYRVEDVRSYENRMRRNAESSQ